MEEDNNRGGGGDRISKLPDDLLHHIISLLDLDMKQIVQTSILSRRWRYFWISMTILNINQKVFQSSKTVNSNSYMFVKFMDMILQSKTDIQKLLLSCVSDNFVGSEQVYKWIVDAVRLQVSVLELEIVYDDVKNIRPLMLPQCLFTCNTLTTLKLDLGHFNRNTLVLNLSDSDSVSVCLTGLKTLHLSSLYLIEEESTDSFFSRCPVLETLIISDCQFKKAYKSNYLPSSIFSCEKLVSLKLEMIFMRFPVFDNIPDSVVNLPSLKCLHLENLHFFCEESTANLFFSRCSSLESLILNKCKLHVNSDLLPSYVFACKTLVKLNVFGWYPNKIENMSVLCSLPLKTLSLSSVHFPDGESTDNFFLDCPVLETLIISSCSFTITENFFIDCPVLKTLIVSNCSLTIRSFFCKSLTKLVLKTNDGLCSMIRLPDSMSLPVLKILHLESLFLFGENSITNLFTSCPAIESLTIMECEFHQVHLHIYSHSLRHLTLLNDQRSHDYICTYNVNDDKKFVIDHYSEVKLNAPNLTTFICKDYMSKVYTIENLSSIVQVYINFNIEVEEEEAQSKYLKLPEGKKQTYATEKKRQKQLYAQQMMRILGGLYNVEDLSLSAWFLEVVSAALDLPDYPTIQFCNLRCLKLRTWRTVDCAHAVMYLLERSPNIESLSVKFAEIQIPLSPPFLETNPAGNDYWEERLSLNCMLHHLTSVKLQDFSGCYPELKFVEFLLKNAMNLQKLMICFAAIKDPKNNAESSVVRASEEEVLSLPRASASAEILFMAK